MIGRFLLVGLAAFCATAPSIAAPATAGPPASLERAWAPGLGADDIKRKLPPGAYWPPAQRARWRAAGMSRMRLEMKRSRPAALRIVGPRDRTARVRFTVLPDGRLSGIGLAASSGNRAIDGLALAVVRRTGRVQPPGPHRRVNVTVNLQFVRNTRL